MRHKRRHDSPRPDDLGFDQFCELVNSVMESLPEQFAPYLDNLVVDVDEEPTRVDLKSLDEADDDEPDDLEPGTSDDRDAASASDQRPPPSSVAHHDHELLGLFIGRSLMDRDYDDHRPNIIKIFRGPLRRCCRTTEELRRQIRATVLHELAHHFGFSEADLQDFEDRQRLE